MKILCLFFFAALFVSCGKNAHFESPVELIDAYTTPVKDSVKELLYSYELFGEGSCSTGLHEFFTLKDTCNALLNNSLNNFCAEEERLELYQNHECSKITS